MNNLSGRIVAIEVEGSVALIDVMVGEHKFCATLLGDKRDLQDWVMGQCVQLKFNEMEVAIAKDFSGQISLRNRLMGQIVKLEYGKILTRVEFSMRDKILTGLLSAVITTRSARTLNLVVGDQIMGLVKSNEMRILRQECE
jgi:molybdate transport system regulatory protein